MVGLQDNTSVSVQLSATAIKPEGIFEIGPVESNDESTNQADERFSKTSLSCNQEKSILDQEKKNNHTSINVPSTTSTSLVIESVTEVDNDTSKTHHLLSTVDSATTKSEHTNIQISTCFVPHEANIDVRFGPAWRKMHVRLDHEGLVCARTSVFRQKEKKILLDVDDILGGEHVKGSHQVVVHYMKVGKGKDEEKLKRQYHTLRLRFLMDSDASKWLNSIQLLVKWHARVPAESTRRIKVVVNPYSGKKRGVKVWEEWKPVFELAGIECDVEITKYSGHARDIGRKLDLSVKYEAIVFVGGDGTVNEFANGVFSRDESEWRCLVATTPVSLLCAGTDNAFGIGVGTPTHAAAVYCVIKRKIRPLDVLACATEDPDGTTRREFACCGVSYGIGADIAMESEKTRWLGVHRYKWLKIKRGVFAPRPHNCTIKYVLSDSVNVDAKSGNQLLLTYYENNRDQHRTETCTVYENDNNHPKQWEGDSLCISNPASEERYAGQWQEEADGNYTTVGASNVYFETEFYHPSDGNMDLIIARRGPISKTIDVGLKYIGGNYLESSLVDYYKVKALVIEQNVDDPLNVDGEVFPGPGPFRIEVIPQLLFVLSEK